MFRSPGNYNIRNDGKYNTYSFLNADNHTFPNVWDLRFSEMWTIIFPETLAISMFRNAGCHHFHKYSLQLYFLAPILSMISVIGAEWLLNLDFKRNRPTYTEESSFSPQSGIIIIIGGILIILLFISRNYNSRHVANYNSIIIASRSGNYSCQHIEKF